MRIDERWGSIRGDILVGKTKAKMRLVLSFSTIDYEMPDIGHVARRM
jgi:hypothetical protein